MDQSNRTPAPGQAKTPDLVWVSPRTFEMLARKRIFRNDLLIIAHIRSNPAADNQELARAARCSVRTVQAVLDRLTSCGLVTIETVDGKRHIYPTEYPTEVSR